MAWLEGLRRFLNLHDFRKALANPGKAVRVIKALATKSRTARERLDVAESEAVRYEVLEELFGADRHEIDSYLSTLKESRIDDRIEEAETEFAEKPYNVGGMRFNGKTLYLVTRLLNPKTVLEIGVANGMSTAYLLGALEHMDSSSRPNVYAIDRPLFASVIRNRRGEVGLTSGIVPDDREAGWIAPRSLREKFGHQFYVGDFTWILDDILQDIPAPDLVVYDASKDSEEMRMAYDRCIDSLAPGGVLVSDDVLVNDAFQNATTGIPGDSAVVHNSGIYRADIEE